MPKRWSGVRRPAPVRCRRTSAAYLTGDGNVVVLSASLIYRINDPMAYALAEDHVSPALDRLFRATTARVTAGNGLNDFLVVQTEIPTKAATPRP